VESSRLGVNNHIRKNINLFLSELSGIGVPPVCAVKVHQKNTPDAIVFTLDTQAKFFVYVSSAGSFTFAIIIVKEKLERKQTNRSAQIKRL